MEIYEDTLSQSGDRILCIHITRKNVMWVKGGYFKKSCFTNCHIMLNFEKWDYDFLIGHACTC